MAISELTPRPTRIARWKVGLLLVEDERPTRESLAKQLEAEGYFVKVAERGAEAIRIAREPEIQIVLLDIAMPGRYDGIVAASKIREESPEKAILFVTAWGTNEGYRRRATQLGLDDVEWVTKPSTRPERQVLFESIWRTARNVEKVRISRFLGAAEAAGLKPQPLLRVLPQLDPDWTELVDELRRETRPAGARALVAELLEQLAEIHSILAHRSGDLQALQLAFGPFKEEVLGRLWSVHEDCDPHYRRIAVQIQTAVQGISSLTLSEEQVTGLEFALRRLAQEEIGNEDVRLCERALRRGGIETLLDYGQRGKQLIALYHQEEEGES
jgi:CheY-like chemotaxis protein